MPKASIIIRAKNEEELIGRTLEKVFAQTLKDIEVIVVDSGSTDKTLNIASRFPTRISEMPPQDFTYGYSLNVGCREARSDYLVLLSAHAVPCDENWLSNLLRPFENPKVAGTWGSDHTWTDGVDTLPAEYRHSFVLDATNYGPGNAVWGFAAQNAAVKRKVWLEYPFDEKLAASEDKDWAWHAIKRGYQIVYEPSAAVFHQHKLTLGQAYRRAWKEHYSYALVMPDLKYGLVDAFRDLVRPPRKGLWYAASSNAPHKLSLSKLPFLAHRMAIRLMIYWGRYQGVKDGRLAAMLALRKGALE